MIRQWAALVAVNRHPELPVKATASLSEGVATPRSHFLAIGVNSHGQGDHTGGHREATHWTLEESR